MDKSYFYINYISYTLYYEESNFHTVLSEFLNEHHLDTNKIRFSIFNESFNYDEINYEICKYSQIYIYNK